MGLPAINNTPAGVRFPLTKLPDLPLLSASQLPEPPSPAPALWPNWRVVCISDSSKCRHVNKSSSMSRENSSAQTRMGQCIPTRRNVKGTQLERALPLCSIKAPDRLL
ncbi:hypothetical protein Q8A67_019127 [Cirrhinus molitorella]|uniref:Uncharacterized protein n=1 Tax=Cirrhinus molitorella TaxID=172907 RepID=A0AA88TG39_9TELE|nr:hypothetical protein Q8A67_019127 [Cirrhinus molitorella]